MRGAAEPKAVREQTGPILARSQIVPARKALAPQIFSPFDAVVIVGVPPQPGSQGLLFVGGRSNADHALVQRRMRGEKAVKRGAGQLAGIPVQVVEDLRISETAAIGASAT